jgi:hypothetical protein
VIGRPPARVIARQYSSAAFVSLLFLSSKEKVGRLLKYCYLFFKKKFATVKLRKLGSVCVLIFILLDRKHKDKLFWNQL